MAQKRKTAVDTGDSCVQGRKSAVRSGNSRGAKGESYGKGGTAVHSSTGGNWMIFWWCKGGKPRNTAGHRMGKTAVCVEIIVVQLVVQKKKTAADTGNSCGAKGEICSVGISCGAKGENCCIQSEFLWRK